MVERVLEVTSGRVSELIFSPGGKELLALIDDYYVYIWNVADGETFLRSAGSWGRNIIKSAAFSPRYREVILGGANGDIMVLGLDTKRIEQWESIQEGFVTCLVFSQDGSQLASGSNKHQSIGNYQSVVVWHKDTKYVGKRLGEHTPSWGPIVLAFSSDGRKLASTSDDIILVWHVNAADGEQEAKPTVVAVFEPPCVVITDLAFSSDGSKLVAEFADQHVDVYVLASATCEQKLDFQPEPLTSIFSWDRDKSSTLFGRHILQ
jgi:WD40 repeat protein